jgi:hypothetical protein
MIDPLILETSAPNVTARGHDRVHRGHPFTAEPYPLCLPAADCRPGPSNPYRVTDVAVTCVQCGGGA